MKRTSWAVYIAARWFRAAHTDGPSLAPSTAGIAVGVAALICVIGVMNGFQRNFIDAVLNLDSYHIQVSDKTVSAEAVHKLLPEAVSVLSFMDIRTLLTTSDGRVLAVKVKIIGEEAGRESILDALTMSTGSFDDGLVIGAEIARRLDVRVGETVSLLSVSSDKESGINAALSDIPIGGIYRSGYYEFDSSLVFLPWTYAAAFAGGADSFENSSIIGIKLPERYDDVRACAQLTNAGLSGVKSWREYNRAFFGALRMEKTVMMMLVGLIFIVVGVNIFHSMRKAVYGRVDDIATLKALGCESKNIRRIFMLDGMVAGMGGAVTGMTLGLLAAMNINNVFDGLSYVINAVYGLITGQGSDFGIFSSSVFYVSNVPVYMPFAEIFFITMTGAASAVAAAFFASSRVSRILPLEVLRDE